MHVKTELFEMDHTGHVRLLCHLKFIRNSGGVSKDEGRMGHEAERVILGHCIFSYTLNGLLNLLVGFTQHAQGFLFQIQFQRNF